MAKAAVKEKAPPQTTLTLSLGDPGMTPILRTGLGGLAAALRAITDRNLPDPPPGTWTIEPQRVVLDWKEEANCEAFFRRLFTLGLALTPEGWICPPASTEANPDPAVAVSIQQGLLRTMLQHNKSRKEIKGEARSVSYDVDGRTFSLPNRAFSFFEHQGLAEEIVKELRKPLEKRTSITLASWAVPGAIVRHIAFSSSTRADYTLEQALCAAFVPVGAFAFDLGGSTGALLLADPANLIHFGRRRPQLSPKRADALQVAGLADAVLQVSVHDWMLSLQEQHTRAIRNVTGYLFGKTPGSADQLVRTTSLVLGDVGDATMATYREVMAVLPNRVAEKKDDGSPFWRRSHMRAFVAENLARGHPWFRGFATTPILIKNKRVPLHRLIVPLDPDHGGLCHMTDHYLDPLHETVVRAIHEAMRLRYGRIASETKNQPQVRQNRMKKERDGWQRAFAGAKTAEQFRNALTELWSRAGTIKALQDAWPQVLPLLMTKDWSLVRDLALLAMATYKKQAGEPGDEVELDLEADELSETAND